jgi:hypothetical protein
MPCVPCILFVKTIATPHLGVRYHTFLEEYGFYAPFFLKNAVSRLMLQSGQQLFGTDALVFNESLIYQLSTDPVYLEPLGAFRHRRMYANVDLDFVVPLGTAAAVDEDIVSAVRQRHAQQQGIVAVLRSSEDENAYRSSMVGAEKKRRLVEPEEGHLQAMISGLNSVSWDKLLVRFPGRFPNAHNKICAITKYSAFIDGLLGYPEGRYVMDDATAWFTQHQLQLASLSNVDTAASFAGI